MTLKEAIQSGKPYRRKAWDGSAFGLYWHYWQTGTSPAFSVLDSIADDWEVREPREWLVHEPGDGDLWLQKHTAGASADGCLDHRSIIRVREVLEDSK